jgi:hypothetical protein
MCDNAIANFRMQPASSSCLKKRSLKAEIFSSSKPHQKKLDPCASQQRQGFAEKLKLRFSIQFASAACLEK